MNLTQEITYLKQRFPNVWDAITKRRYKKAEQFHDYRAVYYCFAQNIVEAQLNSAEDNRAIAVLSLAQTWVLSEKKQNPIFFVSSGILEAAINSQIAFEVDWLNMPFPFDSFSFVLPRTVSYTFNGTPIVAFSLCKVTDLNNKTNIFNENTPCLVVSAITSDGQYTCTRLTVPFQPGAHPWMNEKDTGGGSTEPLLHLVFNLIFAMAARPEYIETGRKIGFHRKSNSEIWTPNIIGRKYAVKTSAAAYGTGIKKRLHWRRGHFRQQRYGKNNAETKIIWLEPALIGAKVNDERTNTEN